MARQAERGREGRRPRLPPQLALQRTRYRLARLVYGLPLYELSLRGTATRGSCPTVPDSWPGNAQQGQEIVRGRFLLGGIEATVKADFGQVRLPPGALAELHGFAWLRHLRAYGGDAARRRARELVTAWIQQHRRWSGTIWAPEVLGERIANLMGHYEFFASSGEVALRQSLLRSISRQAKHLDRCMPAGLTGSALITGAKGLVVSGACLVEGRPYLQQGCALLSKILPKQVLADGGHLERSPASQLRVLRDLLDIRAWLHLTEVEPPSALIDAIQQMGPLLKLLQHPDGGLALFNGTAEEEGLMVDLVLQRASNRPRQLLSGPQSGFQRLQAGRLSVLADAGRPPGPGLDRLTQAGTLAIEVTAGRQRLIVNCGAFDNDAEWAPLLKGTAAHSTVTLAERNSSEVLAGGGLGRRPRQVTCRRDGQLLEMSHDGYLPLFGVEHHRRLALSEDGEALVGEDRLTGDAPGLAYAVRFHLHPSVQATLIQGGSACLLRLPRGEGWRFRTQDMEIALEQSIYFGQPEDPRRSLQIVLNGELDSEGATALWWLQREGQTKR